MIHYIPIYRYRSGSKSAISDVVAYYDVAVSYWEIRPSEQRLIVYRAIIVS